MGYLPIDSGKILIDGENLLKFDSSWLITYVMQKIGLSKELIGKIHNQEKSTELS